MDAGSQRNSLQRLAIVFLSLYLNLYSQCFRDTTKKYVENSGGMLVEARNVSESAVCGGYDTEIGGWQSFDVYNTR